VIRQTIRRKIKELEEMKEEKKRGRMHRNGR